MTTLNVAMRNATDDDDDLHILGKLVCKLIFHVGRNRLLILVIVDEDGNAIEAKTWSKEKAYTVYSQFSLDSCVVLRVQYGHVSEPNDAYSKAKYETYAGWYLEQADDEVSPVNYFHCWTNIERFHNSRKKPASVSGLFQSMTEGPAKYGAGGMIIAQGYHVKLKDESGRIFIALVWKTTTRNRAYRFELDTAELNDCVLIIYAREQEERYRDYTKGVYTVTSTFPPVVNSDCLSPGVYRALRQGQEIKRSSTFCPYEKCQEYIIASAF